MIFEIFTNLPFKNLIYLKVKIKSFHSRNDDMCVFFTNLSLNKIIVTNETHKMENENSTNATLYCKSRGFDIFEKP